MFKWLISRTCIPSSDFTVSQKQQQSKEIKHGFAISYCIIKMIMLDCPVVFGWLRFYTKYCKCYHAMLMDLRQYLFQAKGNDLSLKSHTLCFWGNTLWVLAMCNDETIVINRSSTSKSDYWLSTIFLQCLNQNTWILRRSGLSRTSTPFAEMNELRMHRSLG